MYTKYIEPSNKIPVNINVLIRTVKWHLCKTQIIDRNVTNNAKHYRET